MAREIAAEYSKAERFQTWTHDYMMERLMELVTVSVAAEREACAKVCDDALTKIWEYHSAEVKHAAGNVCNNLAAAIRNRGNS
jgi:hypothetical protein